MCNYLDPEKNIQFRKHIEKLKARSKKFDNLFDSYDRVYAVQKIFQLHLKKRYRPETLFAAIAIFDRYMASIRHWRFDRGETCKLAVTSLLIGVKLRGSI